MKIIQDPQGSEYQLDPDSSVFHIIGGDAKSSIVFARTDEAAKMALDFVLRQEEGRRLNPMAVCAEISSFKHFPYNEFLDTHDPATIKTIIVRPVGDDTEVYALNRLPNELIELLSSPLPSPERRGVWPHGMTVRERQTCG